MNARDLPKLPGIYKIFFLNPDLLYIGSSVNLRYRLHGHRGGLRRGNHGNSHLQHAYDKYGDNAFHFEIVELVEREENLMKREQYYLDTLKPYYNIHPNARNSLGVKRTLEHRIKNGAARRGKPPWNKGKKLSPEHIEHLSVSHRGQTAWNKGKPWPPAHQDRLRTMNIGKPNPHPGNNAPRGPLRPEAKESLIAKRRATLEAKSPEEQAQIRENMRIAQVSRTPEYIAASSEKQRATKAAKRAAKLAAKQALLWNETDVS